MFENLKEILVNDLGVDADKVTMEAELVADLNISSLDLADLVFNCEEKMNIEIKDEELADFTTVGDIVKFLESKVG